MITIPLLLVLSGLSLITVIFSPDGAVSVVLAIFGVGFFVVFVTSYVGLVGFTANVIQFRMDQLHDSPGEDRTLFIHLYIWVYFLSIFIGQLAWELRIPDTL